MTRTLRGHRSDHEACRAPRTHRRQAHPDSAVDGAGESSVWCFDKRQISQHRYHGWMGPPKPGELVRRPWLKRCTAHTWRRLLSVHGKFSRLMAQRVNKYP